MAKEHRIMFRADEALLGRIEKLGSKLGLGRGETIRLALDEAIAKHLKPGFQGEIVVVDKKALDSILTALHSQIRELESPKEQSYEEAEKAAKRVDELRKQGKHGEAEGIINDRAKRGLWTGYAYWPEAEKSDLTRKEMLKQRYGKDFKKKKP